MSGLNPGLCRVSEALLPLLPAGAVELWELAEDETLIVSRFCKYEHDDIVTTVSPQAGGGHAVSGSLDCRLV